MALDQDVGGARIRCGYLPREQRKLVYILQVKAYTLSPGVLNTRKEMHPLVSIKK
jgi:hypothetical protein